MGSAGGWRGKGGAERAGPGASRNPRRRAKPAAAARRAAGSAPRGDPPAEETGRGRETAGKGWGHADAAADPLLSGDGTVHRDGGLPRAVFEPVYPRRRGAVGDPPHGGRYRGVLRPVSPRQTGILRREKRLHPDGETVQRHKEYRPPLPAAHRLVGRGGTAGGGAAGDEPLCVAGGGGRRRAPFAGGGHGGAGGVRRPFRRTGKEH